MLYYELLRGNFTVKASMDDSNNWVGVVGGLVAVLPFLIWRAVAMRHAGIVRYRIKSFMVSRNAAHIRAKAQTLSDDALLGAYRLPDHDQTSKAVLHEELVKRGYDDTRIEAWRRPIATITIAPAHDHPLTSRRYWHLVRTRRRLFKAYRFLALLICACIAVATVADAIHAENIGSASIALALYLLLLIILLAAVGAVLGRNRAVRILLLRPFDTRSLTKPLRRVVLRDFGPRGLVFTLQDRTYRPNFF
jgi:hypothetical protein